MQMQSTTVRYGSPPRWRGWVDGTEGSPQRSETRYYSQELGHTYTNQGQDPNAYAIAVLEKGLMHYKHVLATTDPSTWAWSRPLWDAMFQTAASLTDGQASQWATERVYAMFADMSNSIPCPLCVQHFKESFATFPRGHLAKASLTQWVTQLKQEVDERARLRKMGLDQNSMRGASPRGSPPPMQARQVVYYEQAQAQPYGYHQSQPQQVPQPVYGSPTAYSSPAYGSPPREHPQSPSSPSRTPWAELEEFNNNRGLCKHGSLMQYCDFCTHGQGSPVRGHLQY